MLKFSTTPHGSFRVWLHPNETTARTIIKKHCLWGGPDRVEPTEVSYEISVHDMPALSSDLNDLNIQHEIEVVGAMHQIEVGHERCLNGTCESCYGPGLQQG